jgi:hypothetical protein
MRPSSVEPPSNKNDALQFGISSHSDITGDHPEDILRLNTACQNDLSVRGESEGPICPNDEDVVRAAIQGEVRIDGDANREIVNV